MDAGVRNPLVQQHLRVRMYPDRTYMYLVVAGGDREELLPLVTSRDGNPAEVQNPGTGA
jgi:hypothetical protein